MKKTKKNKFISIDFGKTSIKCAVGSFYENELKIDNLFIDYLQSDTYDNGVILNRNELIEKLKKMISKNKVNVKDAICTMESSEIIRKEITIPKVSENDMADLVKTEISQALPIDIDKYVIQHKVIEDFNEKGVNKYRLSVAIISKEMVEAHRSVLKGAGLRPRILDLHSSALENLVELAILKNLDSTEYTKAEIKTPVIALVEIGTSYASINIFCGGKSKFNRFVKIKDFTSANGIEKEDAQIALTKYKKIDEITDMDVFNAINDTITEIDMVFKYFTSKNSENKISEIFVFGGLGSTEGLDKYIEDIINITTNRIDGLINVVDLTKFSDTNISMYLNAMGAIIRW